MLRRIDGRLGNRLSLGAGALACVAMAACSSSSSTVVRPSGITPPSNIDISCGSDVTVALNTWIKSIPDGSTATFPSKACYEIEGTLFLNNRRNLTFDGGGTTLGTGAKFMQKTDGQGTQSKDDMTAAGTPATWWPIHRSIWGVEGGSNIALKNMVLEGADYTTGIAHSDLTSHNFEQCGFYIEGVHGGSISNASVSHTYSDGVQLGGATAETDSFTVSNSSFNFIGRMGMSIVNGQYDTFDNNYVGNVSNSAGIDLEADGATWTLNHLTITRNTIGPLRDYFLGAHSPGKNNVNYITVTDNHAKGPRSNIDMYLGHPGPGWSYQGFLVSGNTADTPDTSTYGLAHSVIEVLSLTNSQVVSNSGPHQGGIGVLVSYSSNITIEGNSFPGAATPVSIDTNSSAITHCTNTVGGSNVDVPTCPPH